MIVKMVARWYLKQSHRGLVDKYVGSCPLIWKSRDWFPPVPGNHTTLHAKFKTGIEHKKKGTVRIFEYSTSFPALCDELWRKRSCVPRTTITWNSVYGCPKKIMRMDPIWLAVESDRTQYPQDLQCMRLINPIKTSASAWSSQSAVCDVCGGSN